MNIFSSKKNDPKDNNIIVGDMSRNIPVKKQAQENSADVVVHKSKEDNPRHKVDKSFSKKKWLILGLFAVIIVLVVATLGYLLVSKLSNNAKDNSTTDKVLTVSDLENSNVELTRQTSNASVDNLTRELKAKIDKQIADKQNPIDAVNELAGVLSNTTNQNSQDQLTNFIEDFLANHEKTLWFVYEYNKPDQAQVNYWKAQLYAYLVNNYQNMAYYKFTDANGKPIDTTKQQLKYIDLYLALANDPASHPPIPQKDKEFNIGYVYKEADNFSALKSTLSGGRVPR